MKANQCTADDLMQPPHPQTGRAVADSRMSAPRVVHLRRAKGREVVGCTVYIGRAIHQGGWDLPQSPWANPFVVGRAGTRADVIARYEAYVRRRPDLLRRLPELTGQTLGCWCAPEACHGDVLVALWREFVQRPAVAQEE